MARTLSSLEIILSVVTSLLLACCIGLIVVSWISLKPEGKHRVLFVLMNWASADIIDQYVVGVLCAIGASEPVGLNGRMVITEGANFSEELNDPSSQYFKSLAFDVQKLVRLQALILKIKVVLTSSNWLHPQLLLWKTAREVTIDEWFDWTENWKLFISTHCCT